MNAGEDAAIAPFDFLMAGETAYPTRTTRPVAALEDLAFGFQRRERDLHVADGEAQPLRQFACGHRAEALHPSTHGCQNVADGIAPLGGGPEFGPGYGKRAAR